MDEARNDQNDLIIGRNAVFEAIKSGREIDRLFVQRGEQNPAVKRLISMAREKGAVIKEVDSKKLDFMCGGGVHPVSYTHLDVYKRQASAGAL